ncbi:hypothetical protein ACLOJK_008347 [Asimina triloba]
MATYCCEEVMPLELAIHRELAFQKKRRRATNGDGLPFSDSLPLSFPLPHPTLPDSLLLLDRDVPRKRLQDAAAAARRGRAAQASLETIPAEVAMRREISLWRRAERGMSPPRCYSAPPPHPRLPDAITERRNPRCLPERTAASNSSTASRPQSSAPFSESSSASSQGFPPTGGVGLKRNIVDSSTVRSLQQRSYNQQRLSAQRFCDLCCVNCPGAISFYQHCAGKQHKAMLGKLKSNKINRGSFFCDICKVSCSDMSALIQHRTGKKHAAHVQAIKAQQKRA